MLAGMRRNGALVLFDAGVLVDLRVFAMVECKLDVGLLHREVDLDLEVVRDQADTLFAEGGRQLQVVAFRRIVGGGFERDRADVPIQRPRTLEVAVDDQLGLVCQLGRRQRGSGLTHKNPPGLRAETIAQAVNL